MLSSIDMEEDNGSSCGHFLKNAVRLCCWTNLSYWDLHSLKYDQYRWQEAAYLTLTLKNTENLNHETATDVSSSA